MIKVDDFRPVTMADRTQFQEHYQRYPREHSEYLFTTLISWSHYTPAFCLHRDNNLVLMNMKEGKPQFRPPIGERNESLLKEVLGLARAKGGQRPVVAIDEAAKEWIESVLPGIALTEDRDYFDYVYLADDLVNLAGKAYLTHRNRLNRFKKRYEYSVEEVSPKNIQDAREFLCRWCKHHGCDKNPLLEAETNALLFCMDHFLELELSGIVLRLNDKIQALSVYEAVNDSTAAIHFEKAMPEFEGIYQAVNNEAAKLLVKRYKHINRESDLGIEGLRTAKERLHPDHMVKVYFLDRGNIPA